VKLSIFLITSIFVGRLYLSIEIPIIHNLREESMNKHNLMKKMASIATELDYAGFTKEAKTVDQIFLKLSMEDMPEMNEFQLAEGDYGYGKNQEHQEKFFNAKDKLRNKLKDMASTMGILSEDGYISPRTFDSREEAEGAMKIIRMLDEYSSDPRLSGSYRYRIVESPNGFEISEKQSLTPWADDPLN